MFTVRLPLVTKSNKRMNLSLAVTPVPGQDVFETARAQAHVVMRQRRKGEIARFLPRARAFRD